MKGKIFIILTTIFLLVIFFTQFKLVNRPVSDNDEGIYLTSFLLVDKGYQPYKKAYFSQPPGFLLSVYPEFILFGKTLQAARLTISLWSFIGLLAILWLSFELKNKWAGLLVIGLLFFIPSYYSQALTFQSDVLVTTFSLLSLAAIIRFRKKFFLPWFILSSIFLNMAFWTKFDITFFPSFFVAIFLLMKEKGISFKKIINLFLIFISVSLGFFIFFILPFGIKDVFYNSILLRFQASSTASLSLIDYLKRDIFLSSIIFISLIMGLLKLKILNYSQKIIFLWSIFIFILFIFYRPLFSHHLVILTVPFVVLFSQLIESLFRNKIIFKVLVIIVIIASLCYRIYITKKTSTILINDEQRAAISIIKKYTNTNDVVLSDEEILNGMSGRLPPPELADVSYVRVRSNNLTPENFKKIINVYKPKLIIPWNGRLDSMKNFRENLSGYIILASFSETKNIYIRIAQ
ncbi:MAG: glycosyltransferase family 39 protein [Candidatus Roizmanbacteria bacterium]|nr:glycosyltransferase family 39 protein [Candidatus Roizmanbacteria bacterium]MCR4313182.1 glycosyltransferase family 39 protein [Candidatus Roizmanbacteria bacterium]